MCRVEWYSSYGPCAANLKTGQFPDHVATVAGKHAPVIFAALFKPPAPPTYRQRQRRSDTTAPPHHHPHADTCSLGPLAQTTMQALSACVILPNPPDPTVHRCLPPRATCKPQTTPSGRAATMARRGAKTRKPHIKATAQARGSARFTWPPYT